MMIDPANRSVKGGPRREGGRRGRSPAAGPDARRRAWADHAEALADWTMTWMVNRDDAWGQYRPLDQRQQGKARTRKGELTGAVLARHYEGAEVSHLVGLHTTSADNTSRWLGLDIDLHGEADDTKKKQNREAAKRLYERAKGLGFRPLLLGSNGQGGYHLILLLKRPAETPRVFAFGKWLVRDWRELGLAAEPELFPKQPRLEEEGYGNFLRLPGRHHTLDYFTKVWTGEKWVAGEEAIRLILGTKGVTRKRIPAEVDEFAATPAPAAGERPAPGVRPEKLGQVQHQALNLIRTIQAVQGKGGDKATWTAAVYLVKDFGLSVEQALPVIRQWNSTHCKPPWTEDELLRKLRRAEREPGERGRLLGEATAGARTAPASPPATSHATPFLLEVPDFVPADWTVLAPPAAGGGKKRGRPSPTRGAVGALIHAAIYAQRSSRVWLPDTVLAQLVLGGKGSRRWPAKGWRRALRRALANLWDEVKFHPECPPACPLHGRPDVPHRHLRYTHQRPQKLLGLLHAFSVSSEEEGGLTVFAYDFKGLRSHHPNPDIAGARNKELKKAKKSGRLWHVYLPAWLFGPVVLKPGPCRVLQALTREVTRTRGRRDLPAKAQLFPGGSDDILDPTRNYVGFNGNGGPHYHGKGYRIKTWMERAGYAAGLEGADLWAEARQFLCDLDALREPFGLVAGGYRGDRREGQPLEALIDMTRGEGGRKWLAKCRLKVFGPADYLAVWRQHFARAMGLGFIPGGAGEEQAASVQTPGGASPIGSAAELDAWMRRRGITNRELAEALDVSAAQVGYQRSGGRPWSAGFAGKLTDYLRSAGEEPRV